MDSKKENSLKKTYRKLLEVGFGEGSLEEVPGFIEKDVMGYGTALDERIMSINEFIELMHDQRKQASNFDDFRYTSNPVITRTLNNGNTAVIVDEIELITVVNNQSNNLNVRMSTILEFKDETWKVIHWHGSLAEHVSDGEDPWHVNEWKQKTEKLEKLVEEKTVDLKLKNRELEIETALEKVRTVAMGMRNTNDLLDVCKAISEQLESLQIKNIRNVQVAIVDEAKKHYLNYQYFLPYSEKVFEVTEYENNPASQAMVNEMQKSANSFYTGSMKGKVLDEFRNWRIQYDQYPDPLLDKSTAVFYYFYSIGEGGLGLTTYKKISKQNLEVFKRFHKIFALAYRRFQDIQQAQEQAREAQIEAALERVRAHSMAMHHTSELQNVINTVYQEFNKLEMDITGGAFLAINSDIDQEISCWGAGGTADYVQRVHIPFLDRPIYTDLVKEITKGPGLFTNQYTPKEKKEFFEYLFKHPPYSTASAKRKKEVMSRPGGYTRATFVSGNTTVFIINHHGRPFQEADLEILKRFGNVFERTYTRFLDLKKAEEQAREAEIELALERVRARTMAMQHSDELPEVAKVIFLQIQSLGIPTWSTSYNILAEDKKSCTCIPSSEGQVQVAFHIPFEGEKSFVEWMKSIEKGDSFLVQELAGKDLDEHYSYLMSLPGIQEAVEPLEKAGISFPTYQINHLCFFRHGFLMFITYEKVPEAHELFKRFTAVFEQTYTRFLDLKKAEEQAREAEIGLALERVRARTMAMQKSDELTETASLMANQMKELGEEIDQITIGIIKEEEKLVEAFGTIKGDQFQIQKASVDEPFVMGKVYKAWKAKKKSLIVEVAGEELVRYNKWRNAFLKKDIYPVDNPDGTWIVNAATFSKGLLAFSSEKAAMPQTIRLLERFADVFDLTYTRFLDLKKAEAQARDAEIELGLERVRATTMAMHSSEDLANVATVLFEQMKMLGGDLFAFGIVLCDKHKTMVEQWHSLGENGMLSPFQVPIDLDYIHQYRYDRWKAGEPLFSIEIPEDYIEEHFKRMFELPSVKAAMEEVAAKGVDVQIPTWELDYGASFKHGYLLISSLKPFDEEYIFPRFAKVFEQAYTRFLDLQRAEAQAREAQVEAALERLRSKSMGMQKSEELADLSLELVKQVHALGVDTWFCAFNIYDDDPRGSLEWGSNGMGTFPKYRTPREGVFLRYYEAGQRGESLLIHEIGEDECPGHYDYLCSLPGVGEQLLKMKDDGIPFPRSQIDHAAFFKFGYILFITFEPAPEAHDIFKRFAKVFEQTYTRFLDLQKAEAQAREAQIEAALEKVRSRSLAMQTADELGEVVVVLVEKLKDLGVVLDANGVVLCTYFHDSQDVMHWIAAPDFSMAGSYLLPYFDHPIFNDAWESKQNGDAYFSKAYAVEEKNSFFEYAFEHSDYKHFPDEFKQWIFQNDQHILSFAWQKNSAILIPSHTGVVPAEEDVAVLKRFARVFELAYVRFLDIKKSEAQSREAKVELALERIRAQVTAMKESTELLDIVVAMRREFVALDHEAHYFWYMRYLPETYEKAMTSGDGTRIGMVMTLPRHIHGDIKLVADWEKSDEPSVVFAMEVETAVDYVHKMITLGDFKQVDPQAPTLDDIRQIGGLTFVMARTRYGEIGFSLPGTVPDPPQDSIDTLVRFAGVFDLAYSRFEDLQKAEAQAKEAQIELSLERIRAQVTAMQESSELFDIVVAMRKEFISLGHPADYFWHMQWLPENYEMFMTSEDGNRIGMIITIPKFVHNEIKSLEKWEKSNEPAFVLALDAEGAWDYIDKMNTYGQYEQVDPNAPTRDDIHHIGGLTFIIARTRNGEIGFSLPGKVPDPPQESIDLLVRFAGVFDLAYSRFEDLKSAERQNRETQIELALERVRAHTMAMQKSEELAEVVTNLFQQLDELGIKTYRCSIGIIHPGKKLHQLWSTTNEGKVIPIAPQVPLTENTHIKKIYQGWKKQGKPVIDKITGKKRLEWTNYIARYVDFKEYKPENIDKDVILNEPAVLQSFFFRQGFFTIHTLEELEKSSFDIIQRFANVFEQTYTRFLDLQRAEAQAIQAVKQASLDRVRGEISGMRTTQDLERITPLIWKELKTLNVPFIRCGVFIMNENRRTIQTFLSTPDGSSLSAFELEYDSKEISVGAVKHWRKNKIYKDFWDKSQFVGFMQNLIKEGKVDTPESFQGSAAPPDSLHLHFIPFKQGMLYVGDASPLEDEKLELVKTLAEAFSIAYARYEDFKNLEEAKNKIEQTFTELEAAQSQLIHAEKMASLGELTAGIAHEIQNPLNFVNNFSEVSVDLLEELNEEMAAGNIGDVQDISKDLKQNLEKIKHHGQRASGIVKGMLEHSRTGDGRKEDTDINALADEYLRLAYHGLRAKDKMFQADFSTDLAQDLPKIKAVPQDIGRVLLNLINNAFYAVSKKVKTTSDNAFKPKVTVITEKLDGGVNIRILDNGDGIPPHIKDKIFQPFFTTKPTGEGTGLGLSLSYDIVTKGHGGELTVKTQKGKGTEFSIQLPTAVGS